MKAVWKYPLGLQDYSDVTAPFGAEPLFFGTQGGQPTLWMLVDPSKPPITRRLRIAGTGHPLDEPEGEYIGTTFNGLFVWHLFDLGVVIDGS